MDTTAFFGFGHHKKYNRKHSDPESISKEAATGGVAQPLKSRSRPMSTYRATMNRRSTIDSDDGGGGGYDHATAPSKPQGGGRRTILGLPGNLLSSELSSSHANQPSRPRRTSLDEQPPPAAPRPTFLRRGSSERRIPSNHPGSDSFKLRNMGTSERRLPSSTHARSDSFKRRMTFDIFHQHTSQSEDYNGMFRRLSLDHQLKVQEELANKRKGEDVATFQEVFHQMKQEHPTASMGALQQKTMARIAELKAQREEKERRERELQLQKEEEERLANQNLAQKCVTSLVGKMKGHHHHHHHHPQDSHDSDHHADEPGLHDSHNSNLDNHPHEDGNNNNIFTHFIPVPTGTRASMIMSHRRISMDSNNAPSLTDNTSRSNEETLVAVNFAPRKSVGDFSHIGGDDFDLGGDDDTTIKSILDDKSVQSFLSQYSGLFIDEDESENDNTTANDSSNADHGEDASGTGRSRGSKSKKKMQQKSKTDTMQTMIMPLKMTDGSGLCNIKDLCDVINGDELNDTQRSSDALSTTKSDLSEYTDYSGVSYDKNGLIVGFARRRQSDTDDDEYSGSGLIVGFGDRSRCSKHKHDNKSSTKEEEKESDGGDYAAW